MADFYIDLSAGSDAAAGSEAAPYRTFQPINSAAAWARGNRVLVRRGTSGVVNSGTRANINCDTGSGRMLLTSYGDPLAPMPVIDGGNSAFNPIWVRSGSGVDIERMHVTNTPADGFIVSPTAGLTIADVEIRDSLATRCGQNAAFLGADGFKFGLSQLDAGALTNLRGKRLVARDCGGHGLKVRGMVTGASMERIVAIRCGTLSPSHGMGTSGHFVNAVGSYTNISGQVWERALTCPLISSVTGWLGVYVIGASPIYFLAASATPATPGVGEFGIGAVNTLRINLGAVNPNSLSSVFVVYARPDSVHFSDSIASDTTDANGIEGQGIYFDNGSIRCWSHGCWGINGDAQAHYLNDCTDSGHYGGGGYGNLKGGVEVARGNRTHIEGNAYHCLPGTTGIRYNTGNSSGRAMRNVITGAAVGISTNDAATNGVAENENVFVGCTQRLSGVSSPGPASVDRATRLGVIGSASLIDINRRLARAEAFL